MPNAWLEIQDGPEAGKRFEIPPAADSVVLGRSPECAIVVAAPSISRKHARLVRVGTGFRIEDLGSANGTLVNGKRVEGAADVGDQDRIVLGSVGILLVCPPAESDADATIAIPPKERPPAEPPPAAVASPPAATKPPPAAAAPPPPAAAAPAHEAPSPVETPPPAPAPPEAKRERETSPVRPAEGTPTAPTPAPKPVTSTAPTPASRSGGAEGPGLVELVAIGVGSFLAVYGLGWLLG